MSIETLPIDRGVAIDERIVARGVAGRHRYRYCTLCNVSQTSPGVAFHTPLCHVYWELKQRLEKLEGVK